MGDSLTLCPNCGGKMVIRKHLEITDKLRQQFYYFTQWDYCGLCNKVFFDEKYKVTTHKGSILEEDLRQQSFLRSI